MKRGFLSQPLATVLSAMLMTQSIPAFAIQNPSFKPPAAFHSSYFAQEALSGSLVYPLAAFHARPKVEVDSEGSEQLRDDGAAAATAVSLDPNFGKFSDELLDWIIKHAPVIAGFGAPGAGKGEVTTPLMEALNARLPEREHYVRLVTGDYFRLAFGPESGLNEEQKKIRAILIDKVWHGDLVALQKDAAASFNGGLVRDEAVIGLVDTVLAFPQFAGKRIILDGFPRTSQQLNLLLNRRFSRLVWSENGELEAVPLQINISINLEVPAAVLAARTLFRWINDYRRHLSDPKNYKPPRLDDLPGPFVARLEANDKQTLPVIEEMKKLATTLTIAGYSQHEEAVAEQYQPLIQELREFGKDVNAFLARIHQEEQTRGVTALHYLPAEHDAVSKAEVRQKFVEGMQALMKPRIETEIRLGPDASIPPGEFKVPADATIVRSIFEQLKQSSLPIPDLGGLVTNLERQLTDYGPAKPAEILTEFLENLYRVSLDESIQQEFFGLIQSAVSPVDPHLAATGGYLQADGEQVPVNTRDRPTHDPNSGLPLDSLTNTAA